MTLINKYLYIKEYFTKSFQRLFLFSKNFFPYLFKNPPFDIQIEITNKCNLNCIICPRDRVLERGYDDMSFDSFKKIVDQFSNLNSITIAGIGENYLNKDFLRMIKYAKSINIMVIFIDNFFFIDKKAASELIDLKIDRTFCSLDGATKETYEKIRIGANFGDIISNLKNLFQIKKSKKSNFPEIGFKYVVNKYNLNEINNFIELINSISKPERTTIIFSKILGREDLSTEIPPKIIDKANEKAKNLNILLQWENIEKKTINLCSYWLRPYINIQGEVFPCCFMMFKASLGNIFEKNFKEIWNSQPYKDLRKVIKKGEVPSFCQFCPNFHAKK